MKRIINNFIKMSLQICFPSSFVFGKIKALDGIVLTFDDGPHPVHTPIILDELKQRDIKAIFFVTGTEMAKYPELGQRIVAEGHLLANHVYDHIGVDECTFMEYRNSIERLNNLINCITPFSETKLFRPPYSKLSVRLLLFILFSKYTLLHWTMDSRDSFILNPDNLEEYVKELNVKDGDVLLFHEDYKQTVSVLPDLLDFFLDNGFIFRLPSC